MKYIVCLILIFLFLGYSLEQHEFLKKNAQASQNDIKYDEPKKSVNATSFINNNYDGDYGNHEYFYGNIEIGKTITYPDEEHGSKSTLYYQLVSAKDQKIYLKGQFEPVEQKKTPLILWLQGGPGCSSQLGSITEFGPYYVTKKESADGTKVSYPFKYRENTWAKHYNLIFIDNPIGVGFSKVVGNETGKVTNKYAAWNAAENLENVLMEIFNLYQFSDHDFYIAGESFGGHYVPAIASRLLANQKYNKIKNLKGVLIGDGFTDPITQIPVYTQYAYSAGIVSDFRNKKYKTIQGQAVESILKGDYNGATDMFNQFTNQQGPDDFFEITKVYPLDFRQYADPSDAMANFMELIKNQEVVTALNIQQKYEECSGPIYVDFRYDIPVSYSNNMTIILDNVRVLIYEGQVDSCIPNNGLEDFVIQINHSEVENYLKVKKTPWTLTKINTATNTEKVYNWGYAKISKKLSYVSVNMAGHLLPENQPEAAITMVKKWIDGDKSWQDEEIIGAI